MRYTRDTRFLLSQRAGLIAGGAFFVLLAANSFAGTNYVDAANTAPVAPYTNWQTAATSIQDAIDAAVDGDVVLVNDGVYDAGGVVVHGSMTNRIAITNAVTVRSINGPDSTFIVGTGPAGDTAVRCAYVGDGARLEGFTLTNGHTRVGGGVSTERSGAGAWCEPTAVVADCTITGNAARYGGGTYGGAVERCTIAGNSAHFGGGGTCLARVRNCTISGNTAMIAGGGTSYGETENCTLSGNSAGAYAGGGGTFDGVVRNSIVYHNTSEGSDANCSLGGETVEYTCTTPDPGGTGNITDDPQFVDASVSNFRLLPTSPCIDAGTNRAWMVGSTDLDGNPRIINDLVDMGAHEFVTDPMERLIQLVNESSLRHKRPLLATLEAAQASIERGNSIAAMNQLHAFQNKVLAQVFPTDPDLAMELIHVADKAIEALEGDGSGHEATFVLLARTPPA